MGSNALLPLPSNCAEELAIRGLADPATTVAIGKLLAAAKPKPVALPIAVTGLILKLGKKLRASAPNQDFAKRFF